VHTYNTLDDSIAPPLALASAPGPLPLLDLPGPVLDQVGADGDIEQQQDGAADVEAQKDPPSPPPPSLVPQSDTSSEVDLSTLPLSNDATCSPGQVVLYAILSSVCIIGLMFVYWDHSDRL
jgi:hypothetical protein